MTYTEIELNQPEFAHHEARDILGVNDNVLQLWNKLGFVPSVESGGRGVRRKYSITDVLYLGMFSRLVKYIGLRNAAMTAEASAEYMATLASWGLNMPGKSFLVVYEKGDSFAADLASSLTPPGLEEVAGEHEVTITVNIIAMLRTLFKRIETVRAARRPAK